MAAGGSEPPGGSQFSAEHFFATQEPPPRLAQRLAEVSDFVARHARENRRVVLITSGGTTVPLEHNVVRFLDNFSAGTRGAASAEQFLRTGQYAVIFLHRQHSLQPFSRHYSHSTNPFLDLLEVVPSASAPAVAQAPPPGSHREPLFPNLHALALHRASYPAHKGATIQVKGSESHTMMAILESGIAQVMNGTPSSGTGVGRKGLYYLAAAVSDFFLPQQKMSQHKIQSGKGSLIIEMDQVPKILRTLVEEWGADGYIVSFKLETDRQLLVPKAKQALQRYGHQVVIANDLHTRKHEVLFVELEREEWVRISEEQVAAGMEIEEDIVSRLVEMHEQHINNALGKAGLSSVSHT